MNLKVGVVKCGQKGLQPKKKSFGGHMLAAMLLLFGQPMASVFLNRNSTILGMISGFWHKVSQGLNVEHRPKPFHTNKYSISRVQ